MSSSAPLGHTCVHPYDAPGHRLQIEGPTPGDPSGSTTTQYTFTYDQDSNGNRMNRISTATDVTGRQIRFFYDAADRMTDEIFPDGSSVTLLYEFPDGSPSLDVGSVIDRRSNTTYRSYYPDRTLQTITDPLNHVTTFWYYPNGLLSQIDYPSMNGYVSFVRDVEGRITQILASGMLVPITYDAAGRVQSHEDLTYEDFPDDAVSTVNYHDASNRRDFFGYDKRYPRLVDFNTSSNQGADH